MRLYCHYCRSTFTNCYIVGSGDTAIIIDPGEMDLKILNYIENNDYTLKGIFITHDHASHVAGLATILRIYDTGIYAINPSIREYRTTLIRDGDVVNAGSLKIEVIAVPGNSADSAVFKLDRHLFTGDTLTAGLIGRTVSSYAAATQVSSLRGKILSLPGDYTVFPGQGPPTSLKAERRFNYGIDSFEKQKNRRPVFRVEY